MAGSTSAIIRPSHVRQENNKRKIDADLEGSRFPRNAMETRATCKLEERVSRAVAHSSRNGYRGRCIKPVIKM
jgi:hypothetical protein